MGRWWFDSWFMDDDPAQSSKVSQTSLSALWKIHTVKTISNLLKKKNLYPSYMCVIDVPYILLNIFLQCIVNLYLYYTYIVIKHLSIYLYYLFLSLYFALMLIQIRLQSPILHECVTRYLSQLPCKCPLIAHLLDFHIAFSFSWPRFRLPFDFSAGLATLPRSVVGRAV